MARVNILHKHIMVARDAARKDSNARVTGKSVFIKRYYGKYVILGMNVTKKQRKCRDIFSDAQKLASYDLKQWNKRRHWTRVAKQHKIRGAHRMAVSYFYKLLKDNGMGLEEALIKLREKRYADLGNLACLSLTFLDWSQQESKQSPFFYKKFPAYEDYYAAVMRLAG